MDIPSSSFLRVFQVNLMFWPDKLGALQQRPMVRVYSKSTVSVGMFREQFHDEIIL